MSQLDVFAVSFGRIDEVRPTVQRPAVSPSSPQLRRELATCQSETERTYREIAETLRGNRRRRQPMSNPPSHIDDGEIGAVVEWLNEALEESNDEARNERVGVAVRALTRIWSEANPDFDQDAWYPISAMLTTHWGQIRRHMSDAGVG